MVAPCLPPAARPPPATARPPAAACSVQVAGGAAYTYTLHTDLLDSPTAADLCALDGGTMVWFEPQEAHLCKKPATGSGTDLCSRVAGESLT